MADIGEEVLSYLAEFVSERGYSPSIREIASGLEISSTKTVHDVLLALREDGKVQWVDGQARTLRILE